MRLNNLRDWLVARTDLVAGETIFIEHMPHSIRRGVGLFSERIMSMPDHEIRGRYRGQFDIVVRDPDFVAGQARAFELYNLLWRDERTSFGDQVFEFIYPNHEPQVFRRSEGNNREWSVNFMTAHYDIAAAIPWVLATGQWDDAAQWDDFAAWNDG